MGRSQAASNSLTMVQNSNQIVYRIPQLILSNKNKQSKPQILASTIFNDNLLAALELNIHCNPAKHYISSMQKQSFLTGVLACFAKLAKYSKSRAPLITH